MHFVSQEEWVICRIFHKIGERMTFPTICQPQNYNLMKASTAGSCSLPPLLDPPLLHSQSQVCMSSIIQTLNQNQNENPFPIHHQESDLKSLINPICSKDDIFSFTNSTHPTSPFPPAPAVQDFTFKELSNVIAKQCKKKSIFNPCFQILPDGFVGMQWDHDQDKIRDNNQIQNPFLFGFDGNDHNNINGGIGMIPSVAATSATADPVLDQVMSTVPAFRYW